MISFFSIILILISTVTVFAGDIPESLMHSEDAEIFFGEVIAYHPNKENPTITVSPVAMIKGDAKKEGTQQIYYNPNTIGDFKVRLDHIYLFTYFDESNPTDIFDVTTFDTKTLKLKNIEGDMWKRFEKYINEGKYGEARIEGRENSSGLIPGIVGATAGLVFAGGIWFYKKRRKGDGLYEKTKKLRNLFVVLSLLLSHAMCAVLAYLYRDMRCGIAHMGYSVPAGEVFFYAIPFIIGTGVCVALAVICHKKG